MNSRPEQFKDSNQPESWEVLAAKEADKKSHVLALLSGIYQTALEDPERFTDGEPHPYRDSVSGEVRIELVRKIRMDSIYPVITEEHVLEPNHLVLFIPEDQDPVNLTRFWGEWDIKRAGKHAEIVDWEGARPYQVFDSERQIEEQNRRAAFDYQLTMFADTEQAWDSGYDNEQVRQSLERSLEILDGFYQAFYHDYRLVPYHPNRA